MLGWLYNLICGSCLIDKNKLSEKIKALEADIIRIKEQYEKELTIIREQIIKLTSENILKDGIIEDLKEEIYGKTYSKPDFLDNGYVYQPSIQAVENNKEITTFNVNRQDMYTESVTLKELANGWKGLTHDKKLLEIWKFVINYISYSYDYSESWQLPQITYYRKRGDCEDGTILFITLCKLVNLPPIDVFNACGWYTVNNEKIGHSWPIARMEDGKWYVFESTLDSVPSAPKLFKGSNYRAEWGLQNWVFTGSLKGGDKNGYQL